MMKLVSKASSSQGNSHLLAGDDECIMLDAGITQLNYALRYNNLVGVLVTHSHKDHIDGLRRFYSLGNVSVYGNEETLSECLKTPNFLKVNVNTDNSFDVGSEFTIKAFEVPHDEKCYGYLILHKPSKKKILYITDAGSVDGLSFSNIDTFIIECNYDDKEYKPLIDASSSRILLAKEVAELTKYRRLSSGFGHLSISQVVDFLKENIDEATKNVVLVHIKSNETDYEKYKEEVEKRLQIKNVKIYAVNNHLKQNQVQEIEL